MLQISRLMSQGAGLAPVLIKRAPTVALGWTVRRQGRCAATDSHGRQLDIGLPHGTVVRGGDVLLAGDGSLIKVLAAAEPVLLVSAGSAHGGPLALTRAAYQLGLRQVPTELQAAQLKIQSDQALAEWLRAMLLTVREAHEPFEPEPGGPGGHASVAAASPSRPVIRVAAAPHVHGPGCGHAH